MMIPTVDQMTSRVIYRLQIMLDHARSMGMGAPNEARMLKVNDIPGFTLAQIAELQARCDYLDHQVRELQAQLNGEAIEFHPMALVN